MIKKLEVIVYPKPNKRKEFSQSLQNLFENLLKHCSSLKIDESGEGVKYKISAQWEAADQMRNSLRSEEFRVLSGAISALTKNSIIRLNDKKVSSDFLKIK